LYYTTQKRNRWKVDKARTKATVRKRNISQNMSYFLRANGRE
jgi:hypothetical protein